MRRKEIDAFCVGNFLNGKYHIRKIMNYIMTGYLLILSAVDIRYKKVPLAVIFCPMLFAGIYCIIYGDVTDIILGLFPGVCLCLVSLGLPGSLGMGDALLGITYGMLYGWKRTCLWFMFGLLSAAVIGVCTYPRKNHRNKKELPLIPFLTIVHIGEFLV